MSGTFSVVVGDRGRVAVPPEVRNATGIEEGTQLTLLPASAGLLLTQSQLKDRVRADVAGVDLVGDLLAERRNAAIEEDVG